MFVTSLSEPPTDGIRHVQQLTEAHVDSKNLGPGKLYITESQVYFKGDNGENLNIGYRDIAVHAVSRDRTAFPKDCLYLLVEDRAAENEEGSDNEESSSVVQVRFCPEDTEEDVLTTMYKEMSNCQLLHPDTESADEEGYDEGGDGNGIVNIMDEMDLNGHGGGDLAPRDRMDEGQFDDAD